MEILGIGYVIDNYISYFNKIQRQKIYQMYVTDTLRLIAENSAKINGGSYIKARYIDLIEPAKEEKRTAEEIIDGMKEKLRRLHE